MPRDGNRDGLLSCAVAPRLLGLVLMTASGLRGYEWVTGPISGSNRWLPRLGFPVLVEIEFLFGAWLLVGLYPRWSRRAALAGLAGMAGVSFGHALSGASSCGCFGKVPVSPWLSLFFDLVAFAALLRWSPREKHAPTIHSHPRAFGGFLLLALLVGIPGAFLFAHSGPAVLDGAGDIVGDGRLVVFRSEEWVGKRFPLLPHTDIGEELAKGAWIVVLYDVDCPKCRKMLPHYERLAEDSEGQTGAPRIALVEVPPPGAPPRRSVPQSSACRHGCLSRTREWFVQTPVALWLSDGKITALTTTPQAMPKASLSLSQPVPPPSGQ